MNVRKEEIADMDNTRARELAESLRHTAGCTKEMPNQYAHETGNKLYPETTVSFSWVQNASHLTHILPALLEDAADALETYAQEAAKWGELEDVQLTKLLPDYRKEGSVIYRNDRPVIAISGNEYDKLINRFHNLSEQGRIDAANKERSDLLWLYKNKPHVLDLMYEDLARAEKLTGKK